MYVALKPMDMPDGSTRYPGDPVPEALSWPNLSAWCMGGHVVYVADGTEGKFRAAMVNGEDLTAYAPQAAHMQLLHAAAYLRHGIGAKRDDMVVPTSEASAAPVPSDDHGDEDAATPGASTEAEPTDTLDGTRSPRVNLQATPSAAGEDSKAFKKPGGRFRR
jgi:hypothetical protein